jgi:hypothetical protein
VSAATGRPLIACAREVGAECPYCAGEIALGDPIMVCAECATVHHRACWRRFERCGSYACAPAQRDVAGAVAEPVLAISMEELDRAAPLPRRPAVAPEPPTVFVPRASATRRGGRNGLAVGALATAAAVAPLLGLALAGGVAAPALVGALGGLVAVVLGCVAMGKAVEGHPRGLLIALAAVGLGLADTVGGLLAAGWMVERASDGGPRFIDAPPDPASLNTLAPELRRAMRANVLLERGGGLGTAMGSGVILAIARHEALIVTNRHVVDPHFSPSKPVGDPAQLGSVDVTTIGQKSRPGRVVWLARDGVDLALVRAPCEADRSAEAAPWRKGRTARVGETVFAIGNPQRLGWTHTQGVISQFRLQDLGGRAVRLIQTQAAINPGNSGGGLYDREGFLLGINTWTSDKRVGEGISFAIALDSLLDLSPPDLIAVALDSQRELSPPAPGPFESPAPP